MNKGLKNVYRLNIKKFGVIRSVLLIVGIFILGASLLSLLSNKNWLYFMMFVGLMLINFSLSGYCPLAIILDKIGLDRE